MTASRARRCKHWRKYRVCGLQPPRACISKLAREQRADCPRYEPPKTTPYAKGAAAERRWGKKLAVLTGRIAQRTAGSKSPADLVLIPKDAGLVFLYENGETFFEAVPPGIDERPIVDLRRYLKEDFLYHEITGVQCKDTHAEALEAAEAWADGSTWEEWWRKKQKALRAAKLWAVGKEGKDAKS